MNIYNISKAQFIILWIFGVFVWWIMFVGQDMNLAHSNIAAILTILIPFLLVFYSLGWTNNRKK